MDSYCDGYVSSTNRRTMAVFPTDTSPIIGALVLPHHMQCSLVHGSNHLRVCIKRWMCTSAAMMETMEFFFLLLFDLLSFTCPLG